MRQPAAWEMEPLEVRYRKFDLPLLQFLKVGTLEGHTWGFPLHLKAVRKGSLAAERVTITIEISRKKIIARLKGAHVECRRACIPTQRNAPAAASSCGCPTSPTWKPPSVKSFWEQRWVPACC